MGLKEFNTDLALAARSPSHFDRVSDIRKGDCEGQLTFSYAHPLTCCTTDIQIVAQDIDSYPKKPRYLLFVPLDNDAEAAVIADILQELSTYINSRQCQPISRVISTVSSRLTARLDTSTVTSASPMSDADFPLESDDDSDSKSASYDEETYWSDVEENSEIFETGEFAHDRTAQEAGVDHSMSLETQKRDLLLAKEAGCSVGFVDQSPTHLGFIMTLSIPVMSLNVPEHMLDAWDLSLSDYLVLLARVPEGYPTPEYFMQWAKDVQLFTFALGKCASAKPSTASCRRAFISRDPREESENRSIQRDDFVSLYLFGSIPKLLNENLQNILTVKRDFDCTWEEAQERVFDLSSISSHKRGGNSSQTPTSADNTIDADDLSSMHLLREDHSLAPMKDLSIPLVAMQCAVRLLLRSGKYCVICHRSIGEQAQTMRPYVCLRELCLNHYFSLDLGQGIENEVINSPYVVDLLISFFYASVVSQRIRSFPTGLRLKVPQQFLTQDPHIVDVNFREGGARLSTELASRLSYEGEYKTGDYLLLVTSSTGAEKAEVPAGVSVYNAPRIRRTICYVVESSKFELSFKVVTEWAGGLGVPNPAGVGIVDQNPSPSSWLKAYVLRFTHELDDLEETLRNIALRNLLFCMPSVLEIRRYLLAHPGARLSRSQDFISPPLYRLLLWIVASNRSVIVQDRPLGCDTASTRDRDVKDKADAIDHNQVGGIERSWMQFRFVQGSPEKEHRFNKAIWQMPQKKHPTLFAWHGSPLGNWHGIVSTGLNFDKMNHGRAFGNGVYLSKDFNYSTTYSGGKGDTFSIWPKSELRVQSAISICEVINRPTDFVSAQPHYVVEKIDWIQCRFLFVRTNPTEEAFKNPVAIRPGRAAQGWVEQDPSRLLYGQQGQAISIPRSTIPERDVDAFAFTNPANSLESKKRHRDQAKEGIDIDGVLGQKSRKVSHLGQFQPGTLDWSTLPKLPEPTDAASSAIQVLSREIMGIDSILKTSDIFELGWYVDVQKVTNLLHWFVELHSFDENLPLAQDMKKKNCRSIVLELRFGANYPHAPPFVRVVRPRFVTFQEGGGGHVTAGGAICSEMLTNSEWRPHLTIEKIFLEVRLGLCETERPARLNMGSAIQGDYGVGEAVEAYKRACRTHGWVIPTDLDSMVSSWSN